MIQRNLFLGAKTLSYPKFICNLNIGRCSYSTDKPSHAGDHPSLAPSLLKDVKFLLDEKRSRVAKKQTVLKNSSLVRQAISSGIKVHDIIYRKPATIQALPKHVVKGIQLHRVYRFPSELKLNFVNEENEMIAICDIPSASAYSEGEKLAPITVILDNIRNYNNMGVIINFVQHLKCRNLLLTKRCIDIWNPKTIECSMGSLLRASPCNIMENQSWRDIHNIVPNNSKVFVADNLKDDGNSEATLNLSQYTKVDYKNHPNLTLVIGGETEGLSEEALRFFAGRSGTKIYIPTQKCVDSLNVGIATSIILSEMTRQLRIKD